MSAAKSQKIRQIICQARQNASALTELREAINRTPRLHKAIQFPNHNRNAALTDFVLRYLDQVPDCLDALNLLTHRCAIRAYSARFLDAAEDFFLKPLDATNSPREIVTLMKHGYLAHRILEELNDKVLSRCGVPLMPIDTTRANLLMHQLIGEPYANALDRLVHDTVRDRLDDECLMDESTIQRFTQQQQSNDWQDALSQWPCLTNNLSIAISFTNDSRDTPASVPEAIH